MSDFREMLFSETIKPLDWQELQSRDEEQELRDKADHLIDEYKESGMSRDDFFSGGTYWWT